LGQLTFQKPDLDKFPSLALAIYVGREGGTLPSVLNAADEIAVDAFLNGKIKFSHIYRIVEKVVKRHRVVPSPALKQILDADRWAREEAERIILR
jgi:1-deoxy-D-xylulose-5-phosphate reductoisomerase